jgi:hypothetical protein
VESGVAGRMAEVVLGGAGKSAARGPKPWIVRVQAVRSWATEEVATSSRGLPETRFAA